MPPARRITIIGPILELEEEPHMNPNTGTTEFSLRDPDGYYVTINALSAAAARSAATTTGRLSS